MGKVDTDLFRWVTGGLLGTISMVCWFWMTRMQSQIEQVTRDVYERNQRYGSLETQVETMVKRFDRLEQKLDIVIEGRSPRGHARQDLV